ncbi:ubiquitin conjugating enzyme (UbcB) [Penicillium lagena]|uniref:ubiquitin conjugating enzyme (UbcB) n=1 Tax=Penicillium lagena TaxID=94218 RepID=UPI002540F595|nr:ubiquitin conjugating enzyme (UbcB) [Penicillium lagena]KAJ5625765.1 ubiquitin conjugating enzyme (UbcB) [Penicillium lagena]
MGSQKRIAKELGELVQSPPEGITVELADESNLYDWKVHMEGPEGSPFYNDRVPRLEAELGDGRTYLAFTETKLADLDFTMQKGKFLIKLTLPTGYPFKPPSVSFATKIYHPNVTNDDKGSMCLGMLRPDEWKPSSKIAAVLEFARQLLAEPMPDDAVEGRIAEQYKNDRKRYEEIARDWTRKHAT